MTPETPVPTPTPPAPDETARVVAIAAALAAPAVLQAYLTANRARLVADGHIQPELIIQTTP